MVDKPDIVANVTLLSTNQGGRLGPTSSEVFRCPIEFDGAYFDCWINVAEVGSLAPGSTMRVGITFLCPELIVPRLLPGLEFRLWEGRIIGYGTVVEVTAA